MNESDVSPWTIGSLCTMGGVILTAVGGFVLKLIRGKSADTRANFKTIVARLDQERAADQAQVELLKLRIAKLEHDHNNCELANRLLRDVNTRQQAEIDELKRQVATLTKPS